METAVGVKLEIDEESCSKHSELLSNSGNDLSSLSRCRLCALPKNNLVDIFSLSETEDDNIPERIQYCLRIVVKETDTLPKQACRSCLEELELCYQFNKIVEEAEAQLISLDKQIPGKLEVPEEDQSVSKSPEQSSCTDIPEVEIITPPVKTESDEPPTISQEATVKIIPLLPSLKIRYRVPVFPETLCRSNFNENDDEYKHEESSVDDLNCVKESVPLMSAQKTDVSRPHVTRGRSRTKISILQSGRRLKEPENQAVPEIVPDVTTVAKRKRDRRRERGRRYNDSTECIVCKKTFTTFLELTQHKRAHSENGDYHCSLCNKLFKNEGRMRQHMIVHNRKPWRCDYCDKECEYKSTLERHLKGCRQRPDNPEQLHKCGLCPKVFRNKGHLCQHYKCHAGTGFYSCQYCGMEFTSQTERDSHRDSHAEERPLKCSICGWMFADSRALRLHETLHLKKKTYECSFCDKSFRLLSRMKLHMATHTTGRPWQCNYCENWFKSREVIRQHLQICKNRQ